MAIPKQGGFSAPGVGGLRDTVVSRLIPVVDRARDLATSLGVRPYAVRIIRTHWTGASRGEGQEIIDSVTPLLPTPHVGSSRGASLQEVLSDIGTAEVGNLKVTEISGRYTENFLGLLNDDGSDVSSAEQIWYEIELMMGNSGQHNLLRRFTLAKAPEYVAGKVQWIVYLKKSNSNRDRRSLDAY